MGGWGGGLHLSAPVDAKNWGPGVPGLPNVVIERHSQICKDLWKFPLKRKIYLLIQLSQPKDDFYQKYTDRKATLWKGRQYTLNSYKNRKLKSDNYNIKKGIKMF